MRTLIQNVVIVNEGESFPGAVLVNGDTIVEVFRSDAEVEDVEVFDGGGKLLIPGVIDDQVHFREPGLTHKANIYTESRAAAAGGITSFMEMPNTVPNTLTQELLQEKYDVAAKDALVNYSFYMGAGNDNLEEVLKTDPATVCGVKIFMGSSTGNMLVDNQQTLASIFEHCKMLIATHCEEESVVQGNLEKAKAEFGEDIPMTHHPIIRNHEACYASSSKAVALARKFETRLHILHISTADELELFDAGPIGSKHITSEACVHHLWFTDDQYETYGSRIKWNPAVKSKADCEAIWEALLADKIDVVATDHAPHTLEEKSNKYLNAPSGGPLVQHALVSMLDHAHNGRLPVEEVVRKMCHAPADLFRMEKRGYIRAGYKADLVLVDLNSPWEVSTENILYKCGWSPFEGHTFKSKVLTTWVNGGIVYNDGEVVEGNFAERLTFTA